MNKTRTIVNSEKHFIDMLIACDEYFAKEENRNLYGFYTFLEENFVMHDHLPAVLWYKEYGEVFSRLKGKGDLTAYEVHDVRSAYVCEGGAFDMHKLEVFYKMPKDEVARKMKFNILPMYIVP